MNKTIASLLAVGDQIVAAKTQENQKRLREEWHNVLAVAKRELGEELTGKILPLEQQKGFDKIGDGPCAYMVQARPFDCGSVLIGFTRNEQGEWSTAGVFHVCTDYVWSGKKNKPSSHSRIGVDNLPEAIALCDAQTASFNAAKEEGAKLLAA